MQNLTFNDGSDIGSIISILVVLFGGYYLARGLWISNKKAIDLGVCRFAGDTDEENLQLPEIQERIRLRRDSKIGFTLLACGSVAQIIFIILHRMFS
jgi:hypothetical protein